jgi:hypothetical protein
MLDSLFVYSNLEYSDNFSRFLMQQKGNLEELMFVNSKMDFHYIRLILKNFHRLKNLGISISSFLNTARADEIQNIRVQSLRDFTIFGHCKDIDVFMVLIGIFPNIETLTMRIYSFSMRQVFERLPNLKKLIAPSIRIELLTFAKSESLKDFNFEYVGRIQDSFFVEKLAENFPNVEKIVIRNLDLGRCNGTLGKDVKILLTSMKFFKNLTHFELVNNDPEPIQVNPDADEGPQEEAQMGPEFRLSVTTNGGQKFLEVSEYFIDNHAEAIEQLKFDLGIVDKQ